MIYPFYWEEDYCSIWLFDFHCQTLILLLSLLAASVIVAKKEAWRRTAIQQRVQEFRVLTGIPVESHIISFVVGSEEKALKASRSNMRDYYQALRPHYLTCLSWWNRHLLKSGFHITAIRPPTVAPNSCRYVKLVKFRINSTSLFEFHVRYVLAD